MLLAGLDVWQRSGDVDRFDYRVVLVEYVEPPAAPTLEAMPGIDTSLAQEAAGYLDDVQDAVAQVSRAREPDPAGRLRGPDDQGAASS